MGFCFGKTLALSLSNRDFSLAIHSHQIAQAKSQVWDQQDLGLAFCFWGKDKFIDLLTLSG